jgi:HlyD family secretion protein
MRAGALTTAALVAALTAAACGRDEKPAAYGNVEAHEVDVAAEATGRIRTLNAREGERLAKDALAASIDTSQLELERDQLETQRAAAVARAGEAAEQVDVARERQRVQVAQREVLTAQAAIAERAYDRTRALFDQQAATAQQLDQAERDLHVLREQIDVQTRQIAVEAQQVQAASARVQSARGDVTAAARIAQVAGRVEDADVHNPIDGTVLTTYVRAGEFVQAGQRLYTIANLDDLDVRVYVAEPQLASLRVGQQAQVTIDAGEGERRALPATVTWISSEAEFTPTPIQTRDERAELVYAVKLRVANDGGVLKIGMPVDVVFTTGASQ